MEHNGVQSSSVMSLGDMEELGCGGEREIDSVITALDNKKDTGEGSVMVGRGQFTCKKNPSLYSLTVT